jgi:hypothetical protein
MERDEKDGFLESSRDGIPSTVGSTTENGRGRRLSGKFKRVHCILDDTGDVQMQAFQHHSFFTEASLPSSL